jgi:hypothetical protein
MLWLLNITYPPAKAGGNPKTKLIDEENSQENNKITEEGIKSIGMVL